MKTLLEKSFEKSTSTRTKIGDQMVPLFENIVVQKEYPCGKTITWTISRSLRISGEQPVKHYIGTYTKTAAEKLCSIPGKMRSKLYDSEFAFEAAIMRIEKIIKK